ncbi:MAG TPA: ATP-binding protein [Anaerolineaceae bacterium]
MKLSAGVERFFTGFTSFFRSVRFRLSMWFVLVLAAILVVFSAFVYYRQVVSVRDQAAARIVIRLRELNAYLQRAVHDREIGATASPTGDVSSIQLPVQEEEVLIFSDPNGKVLSSWGTSNAQEADSVIELLGLPTVQAGASQPGMVSMPATTGVEITKPVDYLFLPTPVFVENHLIGWMVLGKPVDPDRQLPRLVITLALAVALALLIALGGGYLLSGRALWPVKAITRTARQISETDLNQRLNLHTRDELGELAGTFDRMLDRLQAAFNRQRQFTADASHELRTPLTIIGLETGRALSSARSGEDYRRALHVIQSENEFMARLVGELLTLARMDAGQVNLKLEEIDLSDLALDVVERYAPLAAQKTIRLETGDLPELPIQGDRQYLAQMTGNLVENAIKYSPDGPGQWVRVETGADNGTAWVRVSDNGQGISADHLPHLFDRFYRVDSARSHNPENNGDEEPEDGDEIPGSGLGLSIVQWIAQMHHGTVTVESQPGRGTTFEVQLPIKN